MQYAIETGHMTNPSVNTRPVSVTVTLVLMALLALSWLGIGVIIALGIHPGMRLLEPGPRTVMAALSLGAGGVALGLTLALARRSRLGFWAALAFLGLAALAVVFDDIGWADLIFVAINITPVILLLRDRLWYLHS